MDNGSNTSDYYRVWNSLLQIVTTVINPSSGRPTGIAVDEDTTNANGRHLFHGDLINGKLRVRTQLNQAIAGGTPFTQLPLGNAYPRGLTLQPILGNSTAYNIWVNEQQQLFNSVDSSYIIEFQNVCGRAIEADVSDTLAYSPITVVTYLNTGPINDAGLCYDSVKNTIIYSAGNDTINGVGQTIRVIRADTTNTQLQILGTPGVSGSDTAHFSSPGGAVTVGSGTTHYLAVTDLGNYRIMVYRFGIPVSVNKIVVQPNGSVAVTADTTQTNGTVNWTISTSSLVVASLNTTQGANVTINIGNSSGAGIVSLTATDGDGDTGYTPTILVTPTSVPLATEQDRVSVSHSQPVWTFME